jgi:hypothetical protein
VSEFNPLDEANLAVSVTMALEACTPVRMDRLETFPGAGIYALYYNGTFQPYRLLSAQNASHLIVPIYVGKAVPPGARTGGDIAEIRPGNHIFDRLRQHRTSIVEAANLDITDFYAKYLVTRRLWIPLGESMMIANYRPLWNTLVDGFGVNAQGVGRAAGALSMWDTLHSGRRRIGVPNARSVEQITEAVEEHLRQRYQ